MSRRPFHPANRPRHPRSMNTKSYTQKVIDLDSANLVGYWPLDETAGAVAYDRSGYNRNGAYDGCTLANATGPDGARPAPLFDGVNDLVNIFTAGLATAFIGTEATFALWTKVLNAGTWTDGSTRYGLYIADAGGANQYFSYKAAAPNNREENGARMGGVWTDRTITGLASTDWLHIAFTMSTTGAAGKSYLNGAQFGANTAAGVWAGPITSASIGAHSTPISFWSGWLAHVAVWKAALTPAQILALATV